MNKIRLIIASFSLVLLLSQCRKPNFDGLNDYVGRTETIVFSTNSGGDEKGSFTQVAAALKYEWDIDETGDGEIDYMLVYAQADVEEFTGGNYLGAIPIVEVDPSDNYKATFKGVLDNVPEKGVLRFVHVGQSIDVHNGVASVDFSNQDGDISTISKKVVAYCDIPYTEIKPFTNGVLRIKYAISKFDLTDFGKNEGNSVVMSNIVHNGISIGANGNFTYIPGTFSNLNGVVKTAPSDAYYIVFMPIDQTGDISFSTKNESGVILGANVHAKFNENGFYTASDGSGQLGNSYKPTLKTTIPGMLPGVFTVGNRKSVHFSRGNLWCYVVGSSLDYTYGTGTWTFYLEGNQFYSNSNFDYTHESHFQYSWDTFRAVINNYDNYFIQGLENPPFTNRSNFTVNVDGNLVTDIYRMLSSAEYVYLLNRAVEGKKLYGMATVDSHQGLILLPDNWDVSKYNSFPYGSESFSNTIDAATWQTMETDGAVFLLAAGFRRNGSTAQYGERGLYMSSDDFSIDPISYIGNNGYYYLNFMEEKGIASNDNHQRYWAVSIRLVCSY